MEAVCRKCSIRYEPTQRQIAKRDWICLSCYKQQEKQRRVRRKALGRPIISKKMSREWNRQYAMEYRKRPGVRERILEQARRYAQDPVLRIRYEARWIAKRAIASGTLLPQPCEKCGCLKVDAHHDDYKRPLDVRWLCRTHHADHHAKMHS